MVSLFVFSFLIFLDIPVQAEILFYWQDQCQDDYGPGTYLYPSHHHFPSGKGLWDLQFFMIEDRSTEYVFHFTFTDLPDPWSGFFGFSHPLIHLYVDNAEGGEMAALEPLEQIQMDPCSPWDKAVIVCGWWLKGVRAGEDWYSPELDVSWDNPRPPNLPGSKVEIGGTTILVSIPKDWLGNLEDAKYYVLVGSYDPLDSQHFRRVQEEKSLWYFGGGLADEYNPPIIDILVPNGFCQKEILSQYPIILRPIGPAGRLVLADLLIFLFSLGIFLTMIYLTFYCKNLPYLVDEKLAKINKPRGEIVEKDLLVDEDFEYSHP